METLNKTYQEKLSIIAEAIQESDALNTFLLEEGEEEYKVLIDLFEPAIAEFYEEVASNHPLQIIDLEQKLSEPEFEGLYLPKMLGFSVLRGVVDENYKYIRPQDHFKDLLLKVCESANFEMLKLRIGQTVQVGFALSSDIWITNLIESISNKKIKQFLNAQKLDKYRTSEGRRYGYVKYKQQFSNLTFYSFQLPETAAELTASFPAIENFILTRTKKALDNSTVVPMYFKMLETKELHSAVDFPKLLLLAGNYLELESKEQAKLGKIFKSVDNNEVFNSKYFQYLKNLLEANEPVNGISDVNMQEVIGDDSSTETGHYYNTTSELFIDNLLEEEIIDKVKSFYAGYDGLSLNNECLRLNILKHFKEAFVDISIEDYPKWFELNKTFAVYMDIFQNERFNLALKDITVRFIKKLIKKYTDKRGRDYQDIKKFSTRIFLDYGFYTDKEIKEFFKTPRTKK